MAERPVRQAPATHLGRVVRTERITPHMHRVVLGGEGLADFAADEWTDHYVKFLFPPAGVSYPEPFDIQRVRAEVPREQWPVTRTYSVRSWDPVTREAVFDFVIHGDAGIAGPWAAAARPGDTVRILGPGGAYAPRRTPTGICWPVTRAPCPRSPPRWRPFRRVPSSMPSWRSPAPRRSRRSRPTPRSSGCTGASARSVRPCSKRCGPSGSRRAGLQAFVHGEAGFVKELRRMLRIEHQVPREDLSISGYWRLGHNEDGWQASKPEWNAQVEAEQEKTA